MTAPTAEALAAQQVIARMAWLQRSGSPEAYAPLLRRGATLVQVAFGDQTVPNPTSDKIVRAGGLARRTWVFRNDRTPTADSNPHGFLLDPASSGYILGQAQTLTFLQTGRIGDPDGPAQVFEPLQGDVLWKLNFDAAPSGAGGHACHVLRVDRAARPCAARAAAARPSMLEQRLEVGAVLAQDRAARAPSSTAVPGHDVLGLLHERLQPVQRREVGSTSRSETIGISTGDR